MTKEKVEYGVLIRTKRIYSIDERKVTKVYADVITFGDDGKPRNCNELTSEKDYQYFQNFGVNCFMESGDGQEPYGINVEYT
ncbi:MAG: hypothetical protein ACOCQD_03175, partial [archaeon]